ncbi:MAG: FecR domain-containing protein, partial [Acidobacteria bacterium]|nr:FecR domain-containing protein [Acidobacteriota bacterium]
MVRKLILSITLPALLTLGVFAGADPTYKDYNHRMARISYIQNNLAFAHGDEEWSGASINTPLQPGDRLYAPAQGRAEIQFDDGSALRIGSNTEVTLARLDDDHVQIRLAIGIATLRVNSSTYFEVNTPSAAVTADEKGTYRIEVQENGGIDVKVRKGRVAVYNKALEKHVRKGEHIIVYNPDGADFEMAQFSGKDEWDQWNERRDAAMASRTSARYLPDSAFMGAYDLDGYGRWTNVSGYGDCWIPSVAYGWSPYRVGRWVYRPFWGWTWVSYEPWGWLPYHYGRWFY